MALLCFTLLLFFLGECQGQTHFIYKAEYKETLTCATKKWQINTESDNQITLNCSVQCEHIKVELDDDEEKLGICTNNPSQSQCDKELEVKSGFLACVKSLDSGFLFPFKSSPNVVHSYVFAVSNPNITSTPEKPSTLRVTEGESVRLNCSFTFTRDYNEVSFVVYWIKTVGNSSTCMYSYDFSYEGITYGHHCNVQKELINRLSNQTKQPNSHNISISKVKESDGGQYLCAVQVHPNNKNTARKGNWTVIRNVTVSIDKAKPPQPTETTETQNTTQKSYGDHLKALYVVVSIIVCLLLVVVVVFIKKKCITSQGSQQREEALNIDCSPYAVGNGDMGNFLGSKMADSGPEESALSVDPYSVVRLNSLYESGASDHNKHI